MKIKREARQAARKLFQSCLKDGQLDSERIVISVRELLARRPRGYLATAERLKMLVEYEVNRRTFSIESAVPLLDQGQSVFQELEKQFGVPLAKEYSVNPELSGGLRIQVGSDVWDGTIRRKLQILHPTLN